MKRPNNSDIGLEVINEVYDLLKIDPEWTIWEERGFTWWGSHCRQRVWSDTPIEDHGYILYPLNARSDVYSGFDNREEQIKLIGMFSTEMTISGFVRSSTEPSTIQLAAKANVHYGTLKWMKTFFPILVPIQISLATALSTLDEQNNPFTPAISGHPNLGIRRVKDEILRVIPDLIVPHGLNASKYAGSEMIEMLKFLKQPPCVLATGDETGITSEFPYPGSTTMIQISTSEPNPVLGNGLLITVRMPEENDSIIATSRRALELNELELNSNSANHFLGSWCPSDTGLSHVAFYPNFMYRTGALTALCMSHIVRARWYIENILKYNWEDNYSESYTAKAAKLKEFLEKSERKDIN